MHLLALDFAQTAVTLAGAVLIAAVLFFFFFGPRTPNRPA